MNPGTTWSRYLHCLISKYLFFTTKTREGNKVRDGGYKIQDTGYRMPDTGYGMPGASPRFLSSRTGIIPFALVCDSRTILVYVFYRKARKVNAVQRHKGFSANFKLQTSNFKPSPRFLSSRTGTIPIRPLALAYEPWRLYRIQDTGYRMPDTGCQVPRPGAQTREVDIRC